MKGDKMIQVGVGAAIIAVVEALKILLPKQISGYATIIVAALLGLLAGLTGLEELNWLTGLILGLSAAGTVKVAETVAGK